MPLRLTRNMSYLLKEYMIEGSLFSTILVIGKALNENKKELNMRQLFMNYIANNLFKLD